MQRGAASVMYSAAMVAHWPTSWRSPSNEIFHPCMTQCVLFTYFQLIVSSRISRELHSLQIHTVEELYQQPFRYRLWRVTMPGSSGWTVQGQITLSDLDGCVSTFKQRNCQQDALLEDSVARGVHDEVDYQVWGSLLVQVTLDLRQAHFPTAQAPRTP